MSSAFEMRCSRGMLWDDEVDANLKQCGYDIGRYNIENVAMHFKSHPNYAGCDNPSIRFVRYFPDGVAADFNANVAFFWDAKMGTSIERDAYDTYLEFAESGRELYLFIKSENSQYCVPIEKVEFKDSYLYVSQFHEKNQMPIDPDGWIAPRMWPEQRYLDWKFKHPEASGTPFKYFSFGKMGEWLFTWPFDYPTIKTLMSRNQWKINTTVLQQHITDEVSS